MGVNKKVRIYLISGAWSEKKKAGFTFTEVAVPLGPRKQIPAFSLEVWQKSEPRGPRAARLSLERVPGGGRNPQKRLSPVFSEVSLHPMHTANKHSLTRWK